MTTVSTYEARQNLARLVELAFYKGEKIQIERNKKPMAWLVGVPLMNAIDRVIAHLSREDPAWADTLAILADEEIMQAIREGGEEVKQGKTIPIKRALED